MFIITKIKEKEVLPKTRREVILLLVAGSFSILAYETFIFGIGVYFHFIYFSFLSFYVIRFSRKESVRYERIRFASLLSSHLIHHQITKVATATTLQATSPLWTLVIALILKMEPPSVMKILGVIFAVSFFFT